MPSSLADQVGLVVAVVMFVSMLLCSAVYILFAFIGNRTSKRLRAPPADLDQNVADAIAKYKGKRQSQESSSDSDDKPYIMLPSYGNKTPAVRRRLILASRTPSHYSTYFGSRRIKLAPLDAKSDPVFQPANPITTEQTRKIIFGFFHPYANAGGGGERVLWAAVKATLEQSPRNVCVIYTGLDPPPPPVPRGSKVGSSSEIGGRLGEFGDINRPDRILAKVKMRFGLELSDPDRVVFIYLSNRKLVDPATWPRMTLLLQAIGSMVLAYEAITTLVPDVYIDTMGYPFTYPLVSWLANVPIAAYVHYPVISSDMVKAMVQGTPKGIWKLCKYVYWTAFAWAYTFVGSYVSVIMANSTWTMQHMRQQWWYGRGGSSKSPDKHIQTVYPPCATQDLVGFDITSPRAPEIVYVAQFRAEKRHELVLNEFARFLKDYKGSQTPKLVLIGSIRNDDDRSSVYNLRILARELKLADHKDFEFVLDAPWPTVVDRLSRASFGLDAMWNEHFGMVIVEYMAAGLVPIVHNSAGPKLDIVIPWSTTLSVSSSNTADATDATANDNSKDQLLLPTGFHFMSKSDPDYSPAEVEKQQNQADGDEIISSLAKTFETAFAMDPESAELVSYRARSRASSSRFSDANFAHRWNLRIETLSKLNILRSRARKSSGLTD